MKQRLKSIRPPATPRLSITLTLTIIATLLAALAGVMGNLASATIPDGIKPYLSYSWLVLGVLVLLGIIIAAWQVWYASGQGANNAVAPTPASQPIISSAGGSSSSLPTSQPASTPASRSTPPGPAQQPSSTPAITTQPAVSPAPVAGSSLYHTCVMSYATEDEPFVKKLYADLQAQGVSCWLAEQDLKMGDKLRAEIYSAINRQDKLLLVLSQHAIESKWVEEEVDAALDREHQQPGTFLLLPIRLDQAVFTANNNYLATLARARYIGDFRQWQQDAEYQQALQRLLRGLQV